MKFSNLNFQFSNLLFAVVVILIAALMRLLPHPANVAPIAAMALFGGVYLDKKYAFILPLSAMLLSDVFLGVHNTMLFVYASFLLTVGIGTLIKRHKTIGAVFLASFASSALFFLITNFGVWLAGNLYPKTVDGLLQSYAMGLPFFRNTFLGDLLYTGLLFGGYECFLLLFKRKVVVKS